MRQLTIPIIAAVTLGASAAQAASFDGQGHGILTRALTNRGISPSTAERVISTLAGWVTTMQIPASGGSIDNVKFRAQVSMAGGDCRNVILQVRPISGSGQVQIDATACLSSSSWRLGDASATGDALAFRAVEQPVRVASAPPAAPKPPKPAPAPKPTPVAVVPAPVVAAPSVPAEVKPVVVAQVTQAPVVEQRPTTAAPAVQAQTAQAPVEPKPVQPAPAAIAPPVPDRIVADDFVGSLETDKGLPRSIGSATLSAIAGVLTTWPGHPVDTMIDGVDVHIQKSMSYSEASVQVRSVQVSWSAQGRPTLTCSATFRHPGSEWQYASGGCGMSTFFTQQEMTAKLAAEAAARQAKLDAERKEREALLEQQAEAQRQAEIRRQVELKAAQERAEAERKAREIAETAARIGAQAPTPTPGPAVTPTPVPTVPTAPVEVKPKAKVISDL